MPAGTITTDTPLNIKTATNFRTPRSLKGLAKFLRQDRHILVHKFPSSRSPTGALEFNQTGGNKRNSSCARACRKQDFLSFIITCLKSTQRRSRQVVPRTSVPSNHAQISPLPVVLDSDLEKLRGTFDYVKAKSAFYKEQLVRTEEINFLREKMKWCYRREGVNHLQNCRHLTMQYLEMVRAARVEWFVPFGATAKSADKQDEE
ncbi:hypothetical protein HDU83_005666 [Entophlyctis luteolus]|nr:hypothetical protein HDU83_005666 [Entophlyctis luteolus]